MLTYHGLISTNNQWLLVCIVSINHELLPTVELFIIIIKIYYYINPNYLVCNCREEEIRAKQTVKTWRRSVYYIKKVRLK